MPRGSQAKARAAAQQQAAAKFYHFGHARIAERLMLADADD
jgi:hypothetical protein